MQENPKYQHKLAWHLPAAGSPDNQGGRVSNKKGNSIKKFVEISEITYGDGLASLITS